jgi:hypothetical protein
MVVPVHMGMFALSVVGHKLGAKPICLNSIKKNAFSE